MNTLSELFGEFLALINVKSIEAMGIKIFAATATLLAAYWLSRMLRQGIDRRLRQDSHNDEATICTYKNIARSIVMIPGFLISLHIFGINLSSLFTTGGLFACGTGVCDEKRSRELRLGHDAQIRTNHQTR